MVAVIRNETLCSERGVDLHQPHSLAATIAMLQTIRDRAQGWIAWVLVILISIPFALWGIQSYLGVGGEPVAANVNGTELMERDLDRRVQQARLELRERLGAAYDPAAVEDVKLRSQVLDEMIRETLLLDVTRRLGLRAADEEIRMQILTEPAFQKDGHFDRESYEYLLRMQGLSPAQFEARLRQQMSGTQLIRAVTGSEIATRTELSAYQRLMEQKREIAFARFLLADFKTETPPDDAAIRAYYEANLARFETPEQVKLEYLVLDVAALAAKTEIDEADLRRSYETDQKRFGQPERRQVRHLLRTVTQDADPATAAAVLSEIKGFRERLLAGESFDELAKTTSQDPGSAKEGGSLGVIEQGVMDPVFDQAAFTLTVGTVSEPVRTRFGYHLIRVDEIIPAKIKPFEEVREQLRSELAKQRAEASFYDLGERLADLTYESPDSLEPAAAALGLTIQESDWIGRQGGEGLLGQPQVITAAFSDELLNGRTNSELIEPEREVLRAVVIRVADHRPASTRPLEEVRDQIIADLRADQARQAATAAAEAAARKLREGADWATLLDQSKVQTPGLVDRHASDVPPAVTEAAFRLPSPSAGQSSIGTAILDDGDAVVVRVTRVEDGAIAAGNDAAKMEATMLSQLIARQTYDAMLDDMERRAKVERKPIQATTGDNQ